MIPSKRNSPQKSHFNSSGLLHRIRPRRTQGGTIINTITLVILLGLIGLGVWWVIKSFGQAGQQYTDAMIQTRHKAMVISCQSNMQAIWQNLQIYVVSNGNFPRSQQEFVQWSGNPRLFHCPDPNGPEYVYIPGQNPDMSSDNVLLYEPKPVHDGRCNVLLLSGQIELLTPQELQAALAQTIEKLKQHR
jgi:hypothetical protein